MPVSVRGCSVSVVHILHSDVECHKPLLGWGGTSRKLFTGGGGGGGGSWFEFHWSMLVLRCPRISYGVIFGSCSCKARSWWLVLGVAGVLDIRGDNCRSIIGATHVFHIVNTCI